MARAVWNDTVIAESDETVIVEGTHYFPPHSVAEDVLVSIGRESVCHWKGTAAYHDVVVDGQVAPAAAWYYPEPSDAASHIKDHVAFWNGVEVEA